MRSGKLYAPYLTRDSAIVVEVIEREGPLLPVVFLNGYITLQFLRNTQRMLEAKALLEA